MHLLHLPVPQASLQVITEDECQLWWAAKEMQRGKKLQDYVGKNEKTKLVVKIQKVGRHFLAHRKGVQALVVLWFSYCNPRVAVPFRKGRGSQPESLW